jgi:hypothetical protein
VYPRRDEGMMARVGRVGKICWGDIFFEATNQKRGAQAAACCSCWIGVAVYGLHVEVLLVQITIDPNQYLMME